MRLAFALMAMLSAGIAAADPEPWMKKPNPNELILIVGIDDKCKSVSETEAREVVEGALIRSRIKPLKLEDGDPSGDPSKLASPWLLVGLHCLGTGSAFETDVEFLIAVDGSPYRGGLVGYGSYGTAGVNKEFLLNTLRDDVERAITDYLKANFDL